jgi:hypothetical protein
LLPHWHDPLAQLSAMDGSHVVQDAPFTPQLPKPEAVQV